MKITRFVFNRISVNTYLLVSDGGEAVVIDPGCSNHEEEERLRLQLEKQAARLEFILLTHAHADHIQGCEWLHRHCPESILAAHPDCMKDYGRANMYSTIFGFPERNYPPVTHFLQDREEIRFGSDSLRVLHTPGHAAGSVCFLHEAEKTLFSGDTLFCQSVGRTDLPGGDQRLLLNSIRTVLAPLPPETRVLCGHGEATCIGDERMYNPYFS